jgi:hypothetical protein
VPSEDGFDRVDAARLVTVRPRVAVDESRRECFQGRHLPFGLWRTVLQQVSLAILCPSVSRRFREAGRPFPLRYCEPSGSRMVMSTSRPPLKYGRSVSSPFYSSRHVPAFERVVTEGPSAGGKERRPFAVLDNSHSLFELRRGLEGQCHQVELRRPDETRDQ